jgi:hypothetical protein
MKKTNRVHRALSMAMLGLMAFASQTLSGTVEIGPAPGTGTSNKPFCGG